MSPYLQALHTHRCGSDDTLYSVALFNVQHSSYHHEVTDPKFTVFVDVLAARWPESIPSHLSPILGIESP